VLLVWVFSELGVQNFCVPLRSLLGLAENFFRACSGCVVFQPWLDWAVFKASREQGFLGGVVYAFGYASAHLARADHLLTFSVHFVVQFHQASVYFGGCDCVVAGIAV